MHNGCRVRLTHSLSLASGIRPPPSAFRAAADTPELMPPEGGNTALYHSIRHRDKFRRCRIGGFGGGSQRSPLGTWGGRNYSSRAPQRPIPARTRLPNLVTRTGSHSRPSPSPSPRARCSPSGLDRSLLQRACRGARVSPRPACRCRMTRASPMREPGDRSQHQVWTAQPSSSTLTDRRY